MEIGLRVLPSVSTEGQIAQTSKVVRASGREAADTKEAARRIAETLMKEVNMLKIASSDCDEN